MSLWNRCSNLHSTEEDSKVFFRVVDEDKNSSLFSCQKKLLSKYKDSFLYKLVSGKFAEAAFEPDKPIEVQGNSFNFQLILAYYNVGITILSFCINVYPIGF